MSIQTKVQDPKGPSRKSGWKRWFWGTCLIVLSCVTWLNLTGFCYSQRRYVPDEEFIKQALVADWREISKIVSKENPNKTVAISLSQFLRNTRVWGYVAGRDLSEALLADTGVTRPHHPPGWQRWFGRYSVFVGLHFDIEAGKEPYALWGHTSDQCAVPSEWGGDSDSVNNKPQLDTSWLRTRRITESRDGGILISDNKHAAEENTK